MASYKGMNVQQLYHIALVEVKMLSVSDMPRAGSCVEMNGPAAFPGWMS